MTYASLCIYSVSLCGQWKCRENHNAEVQNGFEFDVCVTVLHRYNNINSQLDATVTNFIDNYNQLNMFLAITSPILRSTRLCLQLVV